jgi:hypothetical protein
MKKNEINSLRSLLKKSDCLRFNIIIVIVSIHEKEKEKINKHKTKERHIHYNTMKSSNITENGRTDNTMPTDKRQIDTQ